MINTGINLVNKMLLMVGMLVFPGLIIAQGKPGNKDNSASGNNQTLLWKVTSPHFPGPSYIFGTMHILCENDAKLSDSLKNIIKNIDKIYFEVDLDNMTEMMGAIRHFNMKGDKTLNDLLSKEDYQRLDSFLKANKVMLPLQMMNKFKPVFISSMLAQSMLSCEKTNGMEMLIMSEAQQYEIEIAGLETLEYQAGIFDSIPYEEQSKMLMSYVDSLENYKDMSQTLAEAYLNQDLEKLDDLMINSDPAMLKYLDLLLYNRNRNWIDPMLSQMVEKPALFAVGAGHLPGEEGVLALLVKRGYTVTPVKN